MAWLALSPPASPAQAAVVTGSWTGRTLAVTVLEDGFEYEGCRYQSLTAIAKVVTGSHWNGRHFFGLARSKKAG